MSGPASFRRRLGRPPAIGAHWILMGQPALVEVAAGSGADAIVLDLQHGLFDRMSLETAVGAARDVPVIVRTADDTPAGIGRALDAGAHGVLVPLVETGHQAAAVVSAARFPPQGTRSGGGVRPLLAGFARYGAESNERIAVGVMIETAPGLENAAAIAATPGLDFVLIGTGDLALSLGCFPDPDDRHAAACRTILEACREAGIACAIFTFTAEEAAKRAAEGYDLVILANDVTVLSSGFAAAVARFKAG